MGGPQGCAEKRKLVQQVAEARAECLESIKILSESESAQFDSAQDIAKTSCARFESAVAELKRHIGTHGC
jgi:hypothetical protein